MPKTPAKTIAKVRPILLPEFVLAGLYAGSITEVRELIVPQPVVHTADMLAALLPALDTKFWVREVWNRVPVTAYGTKGLSHIIVPDDPNEMVIYKAGFDRCWGGAKRSPMHLPQELSRMILTVREAQFARLQDMTHHNAMNCGASHLPNRPTYREEVAAALQAHKKPPIGDSPVQRYRRFWDGTHSKKAGQWASNPWVRVIRYHVEKTDVLGKKEATRA